MYQALYRKYRPKTFSDVIGQPHVTVTLQNELLSGRIGHAYLFIGSRGTGKTTCAKIFAKAANCFEIKNGNPCGECDLCRDIDSGEVMDIVELDAASNNSVNDIRDICESAAFTPARGKYRVYIIDEVHMLSPGAFNALLKTLEEPPAHVIFILATTEVHKIPATILSRCQRFEFHKISIDDIANRLDYIAKNENATINKEAALLIARISDGAMRDAISILDKCLGINKNVDVDVITSTVGIASFENMYCLTKAIFSKVPKDALLIINTLNQQSKDMMRLTQELIGNFRNIMMIKTLKDSNRLLVIPDEEYQKLSELSVDISLETIIYVLDTLEDSFEKMNRGCDSRTELEMCMVKLCSPKLNYSNEAILARLSDLEQMITSGEIKANVSPDVNPKPKVQNKKNVNDSDRDIKDSEPHEEKVVKETIPPQNQNSVAKVDNVNLQGNAKLMQNWQEVLDALKSYSRTIALAFKDSVAYIDGDFVLIDSKNEMAFELLKKSTQREKIKVAIQEVTGKAYKLGPYNSTPVKEINMDPLDELADTARELGIDVTEI